MTERELKLALPGRFAIPGDLALDGVPLTIESLPDVALRATYHDTTDLRLARHGVTLRHRVGEERGPVWTVKLPISVTDGVMERNELHFDGARREPPAEARDLVTAFARREPLVAVATLRTRRRQLRLVRDGAPIAELADDEVSVVEGRRVVSRFRELEIEALDPEVDLQALAEQLRAAGAGPAEPIPKVVRALGSRATATADVVAGSPPADPTMADVLATALGDALVRLVSHDPLARLGVPEGVHQVRVALRRLRSDLRTLGDAVDDGWRAGIEPRLRAVADALGEARDLDVLTGQLRREAHGATRALAPLFAALDERRAAAGGRVRAALSDPEYPVLLDELVDALTMAPSGPRRAEPAAEALPTLVLAAWRRLERRAEALRPRSPDADFHATRIAAKRARYAAELAARVLGGRAAAQAGALAEQLTAVQEVLGGLQDAVTAEEVIRGTLRERTVTTAYAFEAGRLVERERARAVAARGAFFDRWSLARRKRHRRWAS